MIIGAVCCRAGSERVPNKGLQKIGGKTLLEIAIDQAKQVFSTVVVSSDSEEMLEIADFRKCVLVRRSKHEAGPKVSKWETFRHLVGEYPCERVVDLDVGCPFRTLESISEVVSLLADYEVVQTMYEADRNPYFNMVGENGRVVIQRPDPVTRGQDAPKVYALSPAVFGFRTNALWKYEHWAGLRLGRVMVSRREAWDIDTPFDLEVARLLAERMA